MSGISNCIVLLCSVSSLSSVSSCLSVVILITVVLIKKIKKIKKISYSGPCNFSAGLRERRQSFDPRILSFFV